MTGMDPEAGSLRIADRNANLKKMGWKLNCGTTASLWMARLLVHDPGLEFNESVDATTIFDWGGEVGADDVAGWS